MYNLVELTLSPVAEITDGSVVKVEGVVCGAGDGLVLTCAVVATLDFDAGDGSDKPRTTETLLDVVTGSTLSASEIG
jgi:hypothetical protein